MMNAVNGWDLRRYVTLFIVVALHAALFAALWMQSATPGVVGVHAQSVELLYLPPSTPHEIRPENFRPHRLSGDSAISIAMPQLDSLADSPTASGADGNGTGVDWSAEARRALRAFEIRKQQGITNNFNPGVPSRDVWWSETHHKVGEQYKTTAGDWIVWIDARCYQIANAATHPNGPVMPARTICVDKPSRGPPPKPADAESLSQALTP